MNCYGRREIRVPLSSDNLTKESIIDCLPRVLQLHEKNSAEYRYLKDYYRGKQDIEKKERKYEDTINEKIVENHAFSSVEFKKGYMFGGDVKYSSSEGVSVDDISIINRYMKDQKKKTKNVDLGEDIYIAGNGYRIVLPKRAGDKYDINNNAPFDIYNLKYEESFVAYSTDISNEKLFGGVITKTGIEPDTYELVIYTKKKVFVFRFEGSYRMMSDSELKIAFVSEQPSYLGIIPICEYKLNNSRLGIIEVVKTILDGINTISSNSIDSVVDFVNSVLVFYNVETEGDTNASIKETGVINLKTNNPSTPADAKYLVNALQQSDVNSKYEIMVRVAMDIIGVPQASGSVTSGGDTGQARLLGGGWTRADVVADQDEISLEKGEREMLEIVMAICNMHPYCKVDEINVNEIDIKFNRNKSDNLLVKTQSLQNLYEMNVPKKMALDIVGVVPDSHEASILWEEEDNRKNQTEANVVTEVDTGAVEV